MDQNDPSRRQYAQNTYSLPQQQQAPTQPAGQYVYNPDDRFRQQSFHMQQAPVSSAAAVRGIVDSPAVYGFAASASAYGTLPSIASSNTAAYVQEPHTPEHTRHVSYPQFASNVMYPMAPPQPHPLQSPYEQASPYRARPTAPAETFVSPFGVAQSPQYYLAPQSAQTPAPGPELADQPGHPLSSQYPAPAFQQPGPSTAAYPGAMIDPSQASAYSAYAQPAQYAAQQATAGADQSFENYRMQIRSIFTNVHNGNIRDIGQRLLDVSQYFLGNVEALGLTRDDETQHDYRIGLWDEFNKAWLTSLQQQIDMTQETLRNGQDPADSESLMSVETLDQLSRELVRHCDAIEKHGLVDYQMGVAEEEILDLLTRCLSVLDPTSSPRRTSRPAAESSATGSASNR